MGFFLHMGHSFFPLLRPSDNEVPALARGDGQGTVHVLSSVEDTLRHFVLYLCTCCLTQRHLSHVTKVEVPFSELFPQRHVESDLCVVVMVAEVQVFMNVVFHHEGLVAV